MMNIELYSSNTKKHDIIISYSTIQHVMILLHHLSISFINIYQFYVITIIYYLQILKVTL